MYPRISYIIYATPRSGSYLLCEALRNTYLAGNPTEYFTSVQVVKNSGLWGLSLLESEAYLQGVYTTGTTPNGVFGTKIIWQFFEDCLERLHDIEGNEKLPIAELLSTVFPHHQAIMITRRDKVRQAISYWKAIQTSEWLLFEDDLSTQRQRRTKEPIFHFQSIENLRQNLIEDEIEMRAYFSSHHIQPFTIVYEDFVHTYEETTLQILDYLHIPIPKNLVRGERKMKKQSNEQTEEWVRLYYQMKEAQEKQKFG